MKFIGIRTEDEGFRISLVTEDTEFDGKTCRGSFEWSGHPFITKDGRVLLVIDVDDEDSSEDYAEFLGFFDGSFRDATKYFNVQDIFNK